jgi:hypothetical protein
MENPDAAGADHSAIDIDIPLKSQRKKTLTEKIAEMAYAAVAGLIALAIAATFFWYITFGAA